MPEINSREIVLDSLYMVYMVSVSGANHESWSATVTRPSLVSCKASVQRNGYENKMPINEGTFIVTETAVKAL